MNAGHDAAASVVMDRNDALRQRVEELEREKAVLTGELPGKLRGAQALADEKVRCFLVRAEAAERERDEARAEVERLREALLRRGVSSAPCDICGYSGPGYYQPDQHACIGDGDRVRAALRGGGK